MKLIYITDIHGSFNDVATLLFETVADVYIISGDLIDIPFYNIDTAIHYHELQSYFVGLRRKMEKEDMILEEFIENLMEMPDTPDDILNTGASYQQYTIRARRVMQQKYKVLENMISFKNQSKVYALPGNYDMDLKFTALHET
jgi:Icc-related predicted phosphoesterase